MHFSARRAFAVESRMTVLTKAASQRKRVEVLDLAHFRQRLALNQNAWRYLNRTFAQWLLEPGKRHLRSGNRFYLAGHLPILGTQMSIAGVIPDEPGSSLKGGGLYAVTPRSSLERVACSAILAMFGLTNPSYAWKVRLGCHWKNSCRT